MEASGVSLARRVLAWCREQGFPLERAGSILCAVSGGMDSMALLHLLWQLREPLGLTVSAATFDHQLRPGSAEDAAFVRDWCAARGIPCQTGGGDVAGRARARGLTLEEAGRQMRYEFLELSRRAAGAHYIATAHNADDNAETVLLHLLRGTGLQGLGGIPPRRDRVLRPLLGCSRAEIAAYCAREGISHREDESNADTAYTRNFLRHEIIPRLRERNPNLTATLCRTAESLRRDGDYLGAGAGRAAEALLTEGPEGISVRAEDLAALHPAISLRLVQEMAARVAPGTVLSHGQREAVLRLAVAGGPSGKISLPSRLQAARVYDMLILSTARQRMSGLSPIFLSPGEAGALAEDLWADCAAVPCPAGRWEENTIYLAPPPEAGSVLLRARETGDEIALPGRPCKTVKKLFIEARVPRHMRDRVPVLVVDGAVAAVAGFGCDRRFCPAPGEMAWRVRLRCRPPEREEGGHLDD